MTGGEALARQLALEGVDTVFGIPGIQIYHAVDGIAKVPGIQFITTRHEQATAYMADGYARSTGRVGVCMVVPGPGVLNVTAALSTAYACNSPVLLISGQVPTTSLGRGNGALHEINHQTEIIASLTKWNALARSAQEIPSLVREAVRQLRTGTPKPVGLEIPPDILAQESEIELVTPPTHEEQEGLPRDQLEAVADLLEQAGRPVIWVGGGARSPEAALSITALAERLDAPVVMTSNGLGTVAADHPLAANPLEGKPLVAQADLILAIGSRFMARARNAAAVDGAQVVMINTDPTSFREPRVLRYAVRADSARASRALVEIFDHRGSRFERGSADAVAAARAWAAEESSELAPQRDYLLAISDAVPRDAVMVSEFTQISYVAPIGYPFYTASGNITPGYQGTLGYGFATALGAAVGCPDRVVISVNGDGGFGWNLQELATARQYAIRCIAIVFDNSAYGNVARDQTQQFAGRTLGVHLQNPDFAQLAEVFGVRGMKATTPAELSEAIRSAARYDGPVLIHVPIGELPNPWKHVL